MCMVLKFNVYLFTDFNVSAQIHLYSRLLYLYISICLYLFETYRNRNIYDVSVFVEQFIYPFFIKSLTSQTHCVLQSNLNVERCVYVTFPIEQLPKRTTTTSNIIQTN